MSKRGQKSMAHRYDSRGCCIYCGMYQVNVEAMSHECTPQREAEEDSRGDDRIARELHEIEKTLKSIESELARPTPTSISFTEITMLPTLGGNTLVFTGTLSPTGAQYPTGTTFTVSSNDPAVTPSVDSTGLVVTIPLPSGWVESTTTPLAISYSTSTFTPEPPTSPASLIATITPSVAVVTPTGITFNQTT